jgi:hypothetical protein
MSDLTVTVRAQLPDLGVDLTESDTVHISPDYSADDILHLFSITVENVADELLAKRGRETPRRTALLANDARLLRLERLVEQFRANHPDLDDEQADGVHPFLDALREISLVDAPEAIARWGQDDQGIEGIVQGDDDASND